jgi:hypothetical protein
MMNEEVGKYSGYFCDDGPVFGSCDRLAGGLDYCGE